MWLMNVDDGSAASCQIYKQEQGGLLGFHGFGGGCPNGLGRLGVQQLISQAATDQVGPL